MDKSCNGCQREGEILVRIADAARRMRRAQLRLLDPASSEEALEAAREEARALRKLDQALGELPEARGAPRASSHSFVNGAAGGAPHQRARAAEGRLGRR